MLFRSLPMSFEMFVDAYGLAVHRTIDLSRGRLPADVSRVWVVNRGFPSPTRFPALARHQQELRRVEVHPYGTAVLSLWELRAPAQASRSAARVMR